MKTFVDAACNINYASFYIKGLYDIFGRDNVSFSGRRFHGLNYRFDTHALPIIIGDSKLVIDFADNNKLYFPEFLDWCDIYGKLNYHQTYLPDAYKHKIVKVGPNFGIGCFGSNKWEALLLCLRRYVTCANRLKSGFSSFLSPYLWLYKRSHISWQPVDSSVGSRKIVFVSRFWKGQTPVNEARIAFIRACRRLAEEKVIEFQGGLVPDYQENDCPEDVILEHEIPLAEYTKGVHESLLVFNTPAYHNCHGWKLPEYLSMGKIILSTPFVNELAIPLQHGKDIWYCDPSEHSICESIRRIIADTKLQKTLEEGSRRYWNNVANPASCVDSFIRLLLPDITIS